MKETTAKKPRGIRWTLTSFLEDLDFADDITLLRHSFKTIHQKTNVMIGKASNIGLMNIPGKHDNNRWGYHQRS
jgi:hypothetical protein